MIFLKPKYQITYNNNQYTFPFPLSDNITYVNQQKIKGLSLLKFILKIRWSRIKAKFKLRKTLSSKICYYGPFKGEFGHFLAHNLPFLMYLHKHGVKIHYCGMEIHKPFLIDEHGAPIYEKFFPLRDFFDEVAPNTNSTIPPEDVKIEIENFKRIAKNSKLPFWDIENDFYYWFIHRHFVANGHTHLYRLDKVYKTSNEFSCAIFPRSKGAKETHNNGKEWDYQKLLERISGYFEKIYVCGHPSQCLTLKPLKNTLLYISSDNKKILEACSNSSLIITQHSGVNNLGEYLNKQVLIIYKGGSKVTDIGSMNNTLYFRKSLGEKKPLHFAFSEEEIEDYLKKFKMNYEQTVA
ncbi:MAG: hypothetical protein QXX91_03735 [Thermoplasmata archaeon]